MELKEVLGVICKWVVLSNAKIKGAMFDSESFASF